MSINKTKRWFFEIETNHETNQEEREENKQCHEY